MSTCHGIEQSTILIKQKRWHSSDIQRIDESPVGTSVYDVEIDLSLIFFFGKRLNLSRRNLAGGSPGPPNFNNHGKRAFKDFCLEIVFTQFSHCFFSFIKSDYRARSFLRTPLSKIDLLRNHQVYPYKKSRSDQYIS